MALPRANHSSLAMMQMVHKARELSAFEKLPAELRLKVYEELLKAEKVRQRPDNYLARPYRFDTAILCVSKKIHDEAWPVLYRENQSITVSLNRANVWKTMTVFEVATIAVSKPKLVARFKRSVLRLHIQVPSDRDGVHNQKINREALESFLILAVELPRLVRMFIFQIEEHLEGPPSLARQRAVLEPFRLLYFDNHSVSFCGAIDQAYACDMKEAMVPKVKWARGMAWDMYDLMASSKSIGDMACGLGNWRKASWNYVAAGRILDNACFSTVHPDLQNFANDDYTSTINLCKAVLQANNLLAMVQCKEWDQVLEAVKENIKPKAPMTPLVRCRIHLFTAIALSAKSRNKEAAEEMEKASKVDSSDSLIQEFSDNISRYLEFGPKAGDAPASISSDVSLSKLKEPLAFDPPIMNPSSSINAERYLLRHFGYKGDYLLAIQGKTSVNVADMSKVIQNVERQTTKLKSGAPYWISISARKSIPRASIFSRGESHGIF